MTSALLAVMNSCFDEGEESDLVGDGTTHMTSGLAGRASISLCLAVSIYCLFTSLLAPVICE